MADNVVTMTGKPVEMPAPLGKVSEDTVAMLEVALAAAKSGLVNGAAIVLAFDGATAEYSASGFIGGCDVVGALEMLKAEIMSLDSE